MKNVFSYELISIFLVLSLISFSFGQTNYTSNTSTTTFGRAALQTEAWVNQQAVQNQEQNTQSLANILGNIIEKEFALILFIAVIIGIVWLLIKRKGKKVNDSQNQSIRMDYKK